MKHNVLCEGVNKGFSQFVSHGRRFLLLFLFYFFLLLLYYYIFITILFFSVAVRLALATTDVYNRNTLEKVMDLVKNILFLQRSTCVTVTCLCCKGIKTLKGGLCFVCSWSL